MCIAHPLLLILLFSQTCFVSLGARAEQTGSTKDAPVVVATRHVPPFAIKTEEGWDGIAIELLRRVAEEQGFQYRLQEMSLTEMLDATIKGEVDAAAAAITINSEREQVMDFTHPFSTAGLGVAIRERTDLTWLSALKRMVSGPFIQSLGALLAILTSFGALVWLAERRSNSQFQRDPVKGVGSGIWWSAVTMTTVGYGDKAPVTLAGRIIGLIWMFASVIVISGFTASIASSLTIGQLDQAIRGVEDLRGKRVLTLPGSTSANYLDGQMIRFIPAPNLADALEQVAAGGADALVYDAPILRYLVNERPDSNLRVLPTVLLRQDYGIALPSGSPFREGLNRQILRIIRTPEWASMLEGYLGRGG